MDHDIIIATKEDKTKHETEVAELIELENAGYILNPKKYECFKEEIEWVGHKLDQQGIPHYKTNWKRKRK